MLSPAPRRAVALLGTLALTVAITPPSLGAGTYAELTYLGGSTTKVEQVLGDHDWADSTLATASRTLTRADVLGSDIGTSFVSGDSLFFLFGDTIGATAQYVPRWAPAMDSLKWSAHDPMASCRIVSPDSALRLTFLTGAGDSTLWIVPRYPDGRVVDMGTDDVPCSGLDWGGHLDLVAHTGTVLVAGVADADSDSSYVARFDPSQRTFTAGRTLSRTLGNGRFTTPVLHPLPAQFAASPGDSEVLVFGVGRYRHSDVYLAMVPLRSFESGLDSTGAPATRYFTGLVNGSPTWSESESAAAPIVRDDPYQELGIGVPQQPWPNDQPTIGNATVGWWPARNEWLMVFDGGRQGGPALRSQTDGVYFTYAPAPWGPWLPPQLILNAARDGAAGVYLHTYDHATATGAGPAGPTIGSQSSNDPDTTNGGLYAPGLIEPLIRAAHDTLSLDYTVCTWNPYTVVRMRSRFLVTPGQALAVDGPPPVLADAIGLRPNPFRGVTGVTFTLARAGAVEAVVYDVGGRRVRTLARGTLAAGTHESVWDGATDRGAAAPAGVYFVRVREGALTLASRAVRLP